MIKFLTITLIIFIKKSLIMLFVKVEIISCIKKLLFNFML